ncbi:unnamed protein product [Echinostoma caproni]|uniref:Uncharacterized protein n=1 Tax=Echinostoma caproni TaxID=27848 RepID=A0A183AC88_9TREM|nr:unnamed protein product [Echinostoma caproni]
MSVAESKPPVMSITKSLPLSVVSNLYHCVASNAGGFSSPNQLYSPAPVRSGKTPMSPVAPLDSQYAFSTELSDEEEEVDCDYQLNELSRFTMSPTRNRVHPFYNNYYKQFATRASTGFGAGRITNGNSTTDQSSLISPLNLSVSTRTKQLLASSLITGHLDTSPILLLQQQQQQQIPTATDTLSQIVKSRSVLDFDSRPDEEFAFRMQAEPFSLARDSVATGELCVGVVCDESGLPDGLTQSVLEEFDMTDAKIQTDNKMDASVRQITNPASILSVDQSTRGEQDAVGSSCAE